MNVLAAKKTFPCYRNEQGVVIFSAENIPLSATEIERKNVYRICFNGVIDKEAFDCTYISYKRRNRTLRPKDLRKPDCFATSCFADLNDALVKKEAWSGNNPSLIIAIGDITKDSGVSCTDESLKNNGNNSHINWWIYLEYEPHKHFKLFEEMKTNEK